MTGIALEPFVGTNPLGFIAALGVLDVATRTGTADPAPILRWTDALVPRAVLTGPVDLGELVSRIDDDRASWLRSPLLRWPAEAPLTDVKPSPKVLHEWAQAMIGRPRWETDLFCALLAEGALAGKLDSKPTHLHFTAGQQKFLSMVRELAEKVDAAAIEEALRGPWRYDSTLPSLSWDVRGERIYALRGFDPAGEKRTGVPGADWLAFLGLTFFPVVAKGRVLETTACWGSWKSGSFVWPLWDAPLPVPVVRSLLADRDLRDQPEGQRRARGVFRLLESTIRRSNQGGYGSFTPPQPASPRRSTRAGRAAAR